MALNLLDSTMANAEFMLPFNDNNVEVDINEIEQTIETLTKDINNISTEINNYNSHDDTFKKTSENAEAYVNLNNQLQQARIELNTWNKYKDICAYKHSNQEDLNSFHEQYSTQLLEIQNQLTSYHDALNNSVGTEEEEKIRREIKFCNNKHKEYDYKLRMINYFGGTLQQLGKLNLQDDKSKDKGGINLKEQVVTPTQNHKGTTGTKPKQSDRNLPNSATRTNSSRERKAPERYQDYYDTPKYNYYNTNRGGRGQRGRGKSWNNYNRRSFDKYNDSDYANFEDTTSASAPLTTEISKISKITPSPVTASKTNTENIHPESSNTQSSQFTDNNPCHDNTCTQQTTFPLMPNVPMVTEQVKYYFNPNDGHYYPIVENPYLQQFSLPNMTTRCMPIHNSQLPQFQIPTASAGNIFMPSNSVPITTLASTNVTTTSSRVGVNNLTNNPGGQSNNNNNPISGGNAGFSYTRVSTSQPMPNTNPTSNNYMNYNPSAFNSNMNNCHLPGSQGSIPYNIIVKTPTRIKFTPYTGRNIDDLDKYLQMLVEHTLNQLGGGQGCNDFTIISEIQSQLGPNLLPFTKTIDVMETTYLEFIEQLKENYNLSCKKNHSNSTDEFYFAQLISGESMGEFAARLKSLAKKAFPNRPLDEIENDRSIFNVFYRNMPEEIQVYIKKAISNAQLSGHTVVENWQNLVNLIHNIVENLGEEAVNRIFGKKEELSPAVTTKKRKFIPSTSRKTTAKVEAGPRNQQSDDEEVFGNENDYEVPPATQEKISNGNKTEDKIADNSTHQIAVTNNSEPSLEVNGNIFGQFNIKQILKELADMVTKEITSKLLSEMPSTTKDERVTSGKEDKADHNPDESINKKRPRTPEDTSPNSKSIRIDSGKYAVLNDEMGDKQKKDETTETLESPPAQHKNKVNTVHSKKNSSNEKKDPDNKDQDLKSNNHNKLTSKKNKRKNMLSESAQEKKKSKTQQDLNIIKPMLISPVTHQYMYCFLTVNGYSAIARINNTSPCSYIRRDILSPCNLKNVADSTKGNIISFPSQIHDLNNVISNFTINPNLKEEYEFELGVDFLKENGLLIDVKKKIISKRWEDGMVWSLKMQRNNEACRQFLSNAKIVVSEPNSHGQEIIVPSDEFSTRITNNHRCKCNRFTNEDIQERNNTVRVIKLNQGIEEKNFEAIMSISNLINHKNEIDSNLKITPTLGSIDSLLYFEDEQLWDYTEETLPPNTRNIIGKFEFTTPNILEDDEEDELVNENWSKEELFERLNVEEKDEKKNISLKEIIWQHKDVFNKEEQVSPAKLKPMNIFLKDDIPIYIQQYPIKPEFREKVREECQKLLKGKMIEETTSPYNFPLMAVAKKSGEVRLVLDLRSLNLKALPYNYPLPDIGQTLHRMHGMKYFSSMDLSSGFWQQKLAKKDRPKCAFTLEGTQYQLTRAPQGFSATPLVFQREMNMVFGDLMEAREMGEEKVRKVRLTCYIDDLIISSETEEIHREMLTLVLQRLKKYSLKLKINKCVFAASQLEFLGHEIGQKGIKASPKYIQKVLEIPRPTKVCEVMQLMGSYVWIQKFIPRFAERGRPFSCLQSSDKVKMRSKISWSPELETTYLDLQEAIKEETILAYADESETATTLNLECSASDIACSGILKQTQGGEERIIEYYSSVFNKNQIRYPKIEKLICSIRMNFKHFSHLLKDKEFNLYLPPSCIHYLSMVKPVCSRLTRTYEEINAFNFRLINKLHLSDETEGFVDTLIQHNYKIDKAEKPRTLRKRKWLTRGGGDSLLEALIYCQYGFNVVNNIKLKQDHISKLREELYQEMMKKRKTLNIEIDSNNKNWYKSTQLNEHPCPPEFIQCFANLRGRDILIFCDNGYPAVYKSNKPQNPKLAPYLLVCISGIHFDVMHEDCWDNNINTPEECIVPNYSSSEKVEDTNEKDEILIKYKVTNTPSSNLCQIKDCPIGPDKCTSIVKLGTQLILSCTLYDTACSTSIISDNTVEKLIEGEDYWFVKNVDLTINAAGGHIVRLISPIITLDVDVGGILFPKQKFMVLPAERMPYCCLLGLNFLTNNEILLHYDTMSISFQGRELEKMYDPIGYDPVKFNSSIKTEIEENENKKENTDKVINSNLKTNSEEFTHKIKQMRDKYDNFQFDIKNPTLIKYLNGETEIKRLQTIQDNNEYQDINGKLLKDIEIELVKQNINNNNFEWPKTLYHFWKHKGNLIILPSSGLLVLVDEEEEKIRVIVPKNWIVDITTKIHLDNKSHHTSNYITSFLSEIVYHPEMETLIRECVKACPTCSFKSPFIFNKKRKVNNNTSLVTDTSPFQTIMMAATEMPKDKQTGHQYCLIIQDDYSKWVISATLPSLSDETITKTFREQILPHLIAHPHYLVVGEKGPPIGTKFQTLLTEFRIQIIKEQGTFMNQKKVESFNNTLEKLLSILQMRVNPDKINQWSHLWGMTIFEYNSLYHKGIKTTPRKLLLHQIHNVTPNKFFDLKLLGIWEEAKYVQVFAANSRVWKMKAPNDGYSNNTCFPNDVTGIYRIVSLGNYPLTYVLKLENDPKETLVLAHHSQLFLANIPRDDAIINNVQFQELFSGFPSFNESSKRVDKSLGIIKNKSLYKNLADRCRSKIPPKCQSPSDPTEDNNKHQNKWEKEFEVPRYTPCADDYGDIYLTVANKTAEEMVSRFKNIPQTGYQSHLIPPLMNNPINAELYKKRKENAIHDPVTNSCFSPPIRNPKKIRIIDSPTEIWEYDASPNTSTILEESVVEPSIGEEDKSSTDSPNGIGKLEDLEVSPDRKIKKEVSVPTHQYALRSRGKIDCDVSQYLRVDVTKS